MINYLERITVAAVAIFLSSVILFPSSPLSSPYYSIVYAVVLTGGPGNDVLTGGFGADSFNCGPGDDIIKDFNKAEGDTTSKNCERSEEPIDCKLIVKVIEELRAKRNILQEKLQSASTNQEPDLVAQIESLRSQIESLKAQISNAEKQAQQ
ncbi:MAG: hypothetical protein M3P28_00515 [Thermoproteota archaeon]|nr:hypothetical protein [Thermoproteota archaeon]